MIDIFYSTNSTRVVKMGNPVRPGSIHHGFMI